MKNLKLSGITFTQKNGKTIELSIEDAKKLYEQLEGLFGVKAIPYNPPIFIDRPVIVEKPYIPYQPIYTELTCSPINLVGEIGGGSSN